MVPVWVALAVLLDGVVALAGGLLPERWLVRHRAEMLGFAAGALLAVALLDLGPIASPSWMLVGVCALAGAEWLLVGHEHHHARRHGALPYALLGSDALHNFGDGIAIAAAFATSLHLGAITSLAVIVHELPEEIADYAVLRAAQIGKRRSLLALALVQLTAGLGAAVTLLGIGVSGANRPLLGIAGGTFVYIALVELLPGVLRDGSRRDRGAALLGLIVGVLVIAVI